MKVKVPQQIQVGGHVYRIVLRTQELQDVAARGRVSHQRQQIELEDERLESQRMESFIHEVLHVIDAVYGEDRVEERTIGSFAEGLTQIFVQLGIEFDWEDITE